MQCVKKMKPLERKKKKKQTYVVNNSVHIDNVTLLSANGLEEAGVHFMIVQQCLALGNGCGKLTRA